MVQLAGQGRDGGGPGVMTYSKLQSSGGTCHSRLKSHRLALTRTIVDSRTVRIGIKDGGPVVEGYVAGT